MTDDNQNAIQTLKRFGLILYPTDTVWGLGCDATCEKVVSKIYQMKQRDDSKALICLVKDIEMLADYVEPIPEKAYNYLENTDRPTSIIYPKAKNLAPNLVAAYGCISLRICRTVFCQ